MDCARLIRGIASMAKLVTPASASALTVSALVSGWRKPTRTEPCPRRPISSELGGPTLAITSPEKPSPIVAPVSVYSASGWWAVSPAPDSTTTSWPPGCTRRWATSGTSATRCSPAELSFGTEIFMRRRVPRRGGARKATSSDAGGDDQGVSWPPRSALGRALEVIREQGPRALWFKLWGELLYRRVALFELALDARLPELAARVPLEMGPYVDGRAAPG